MKLDDALATFLNQIGRLDEYEELGSQTSLDAEVSGEMPGLIAKLDQSQITSDRIVWVLVALHVALFIACVYIGVAYATNTAVVTVLLGGGSLLGILKILASLKDAWREKVLIDLLKSVAPSLSPRDLVTLIETIFHKKKPRVPQRRRPVISRT
jgi:hypothetical protein